MRRRSLKLLIKIIILTTLFLFILTKVPNTSFRNHKFLEKFAQSYIKEPLAKKDWHDWQAMHIDSQRVGIGEQGKAGNLGNKTDKVLEEKSIQQHGLNAILSDAISVNRSVPDLRDKGCLYKKYLTKLPTVSIVIPFHNEYLSTFFRTLHSLVNRTPPELLKEIILVDDFSDVEFFRKLEEYVTVHFDKVQFVRLPERLGLIRARLAGARKMTAEVLVILDAHIEVNYNWLPPLLEPIALNKRTVVCPLINWITASDLTFSPVAPKQGGFHWGLNFIQTDIVPKDLRGSTEPFKNPIMYGGLFAMSLDFFWELGGYDEGLEIWGAEQYELSFKIWMCGGQLLNAPCSIVAHHFRGNLNKGLNAKNPQYLLRNKKRVVEVWMDEYKKYFYDREGGDIEKIDAGDLTKQRALREKLHCKSFKWFMNEIAVNILKEFPPVEPLEYTSGAIQSVALPKLCIDTLGGTLPGLYTCMGKPTLPTYNQLFILRWSRDIRWRSTSMCLDVPKQHKNARVILYHCHNQGGTQFWYYDRSNKWLVHGPNGNYCLEALPSNWTLFMNICEKDNLNMKWNFGAVNDTALDKFFENIKI